MRRKGGTGERARRGEETRKEYRLPMNVSFREKEKLYKQI